MEFCDSCPNIEMLEIGTQSELLSIKFILINKYLVD